MSHQEIAAALALDDVSAGERLTVFSLASFANRDERAWPGTRIAATRAGLSRSQYLQARDRLARRGLISVDADGGGRGSTATVTLRFAQGGPRVDVEINAELFEVVLSYSRTRGSARLLLGALAGVADTAGMIEGVTTDELRELAGLADTTYRRVRARLLEDGDVGLDEAGGGRAKTNRWRIRDPRLIGQPPLSAPQRRVAQSRSGRPLIAPAPRVADTDQTQPSTAARSAVIDRPPGAGSSQNPGQSRTVPRRNPGQSRTLSPETPPETPPQTPPPNAPAGREPRNLGTTPPNPPQGGSFGADLAIEEPYVSSRRRKRRRTVRVDLDAVRRRLGLPTANDRADWQQIRSLLSDAVDEDVFAIWFEALELVAIDDTGGLVVAGDPTVCSWVRGRFGPLFADCAQRIGRQLRVADEPEQRALTVSAVHIDQQEVS